MTKKTLLFFKYFLFAVFFYSCSKSSSDAEIAINTTVSFTVNNTNNGTLAYSQVNVKPVIVFNLTEPANAGTIQESISFSGPASAAVSADITIGNGNKQITIIPTNDLLAFTEYTVSISSKLKSSTGGRLINPTTITLTTGINRVDKFPRISTDELLTKVQQQTFKYFWDFGHPESGLARERNTSGETVTSGGSGFGIMAIPVGISRGFITRAQGFTRVEKIVDFLKNKAVRVKGAFSHWINGTTGAIIPFSADDNGADIVETSYLIMGLLTAREYFDGTGADETALRAKITTLYNEVEWDWFRRGSQNILYWHYSTDKGWAINLPIRGWNECLVTYVLAISSPTHGVPNSVYTNGWKGDPAFANGNTHYGYNLPLGPAMGGPLFFSHYSFMGIDPTGLKEGGIDYSVQTKNHTLINRAYCIANPKAWYGYSDSCWGLTASDIKNGYTASSPTNDGGYIAPTAALSSMPYTPAESLAALDFFYYKLGDKIFKDYGFVDAFSLHEGWFAASTLAIDQGPIIAMIENYRTGLLWSLFMKSPEVKAGMNGLGFTSPRL